MSELEKQITGDWYEVRRALDEPDTLVDFLEISPAEFTRAAEQLRFAVEQGIVEYKRGLLHSIMSPLKSLKWDSRAITDLTPPLRESAMGVLSPAVQRLFALGLLRLYSQKSSEEATGSQEKPEGAYSQASHQQREAPQEEASQNMPTDIKTVVEEVKNMLKERPLLRNHQEVKKIMLQLKYYNTELEKMRSLAPNIPPEKAAGFKQNFQATFNEISQKIAASYNALINEEIEKHRPKEQLPVLKRYDFTNMDKLFREQIANATRIYSTIRHADQERYQMREILVELSAGEPYHAGFFDRELKAYKQLAPFGEDNLKISRAFGNQLQRYYDRYAEWISR